MNKMMFSISNIMDMQRQLGDILSLWCPWRYTHFKARVYLKCISPYNVCEDKSVLNGQLMTGRQVCLYKQQPDGIIIEMGMGAYTSDSLSSKAFMVLTSSQEKMMDIVV